MEKIKLQGDLIVWSIGPNRWILSRQECTQAYLTGKHPHFNRKLSTASLNKFLNIIKKFAGENHIKLLRSIKNYNKILPQQLQRDDKKLGNGKYATVYENSGYAIKVIDHKFYKDLPKLDGALEVRVLKLLYNQITNNYISPNIITLYQYTPTSNIDYIVMEKLDMTFWKLLQTSTSIKVIKGIILQIVFTLLMLQEQLPGFRHNDLKVDNVLIDMSTHNKITLRYKNSFWIIPENVPIVKFADFDYSNIPNKIKNCKVGTKHSKTFGCTATTSKVYDLHLFLNSLYSYRINLPRQITEWLQRQLPTTLRGNENTGVKYGRLKNPEQWENKLPTPHAILTSKFLSEFRTMKPALPVWGI